MATVGKNILDNLTTGMYSDSKVIYREYIQNACDQIDIAHNSGILSSNERGMVDIYLDPSKRYISIINSYNKKVVNLYQITTFLLYN